MRGNGRIFQRGQIWWAAYYLRGKEFRESTREIDEGKTRRFLQHKLKLVGADQIGAQSFTTPKATRFTVHDLLESLKKDFELRGKLSPQNKSGLARAESDFGNYRALALTAENVDAYVQERLAQGDTALHKSSAKPIGWQSGVRI